MSVKVNLVVSAVGIIISAKELPLLRRKKSIREILVYLLLLGIGVWLSIMAGNLEQVVTPLIIIETIFKPVIQMLKYIFS